MPPPEVAEDLAAYHVHRALLDARMQALVGLVAHDPRLKAWSQRSHRRLIVPRPIWRVLAGCAAWHSTRTNAPLSQPRQAARAPILSQTFQKHTANYIIFPARDCQTKSCPMLCRLLRPTAGAACESGLIAAESAVG